MIDLKKLIKSGEDLARNMLLNKNKRKRVKQLVPMFHLVAPEGGGRDIIIGCEWSNTDEKYYAIEMVKEKAHKMGAVAAMFITEAWMVVYDKAHPIGERIDPPSQDPRRIEAVMAIALDNEGNQEASRLLITRDKPGGIITALVADNTLNDNATYQFNIIDGLLPPKNS